MEYKADELAILTEEQIIALKAEFPYLKNDSAFIMELPTECTAIELAKTFPKVFFGTELGSTITEKEGIEIYSILSECYSLARTTNVLRTSPILSESKCSLNSPALGFKFFKPDVSSFLVRRFRTLSPEFKVCTFKNITEQHANVYIIIYAHIVKIYCEYLFMYYYNKFDNLSNNKLSKDLSTDLLRELDAIEINIDTISDQTRGAELNATMEKFINIYKRIKKDYQIYLDGLNPDELSPSNLSKININRFNKELYKVMDYIKTQCFDTCVIQAIEEAVLYLYDCEQEKLYKPHPEFKNIIEKKFPKTLLGTCSLDIMEKVVKLSDAFMLSKSFAEWLKYNFYMSLSNVPENEDVVKMLDTATNLYGNGLEKYLKSKI